MKIRTAFVITVIMLMSACTARREALRTPDPPDPQTTAADSKPAADPKPAAPKPAADQKPISQPGAAAKPSSAVPAPPTPQQVGENEKKLDGTLIEIARANRSGGQASAVKQLTASGAEQRNQKVSIELIATNNEAVPELKKRLKDSGAEIVSDLENHIWVYLPLSAIDQFSGMSSVWSMAVARPTNTIQKK
jgi:hypothetical protein